MICVVSAMHRVHRRFAVRSTSILSRLDLWSHCNRLVHNLSDPCAHNFAAQLRIEQVST